MKHNLEALKHIIDSSNRIIFFTGVSVSAAGDVPDFRSMGGLFDEISKDGLSPGYLSSCGYLEDDPEGFINFCHKRLLFVDTMPDIVHDWTARLERNQQSLGVITQNIDGLYSDAGSQHVDKLHGTSNRFYCNACHKSYMKLDVIDRTLKHCDSCDGAIRPDIVLYDEMLDQPTIIRALNKIEDADTLVVLDSSLVVQPAAGLISNFKGDDLIIINKDRTPYDNNATLVIHDDMVSVVKSLMTE